MLNISDPILWQQDNRLIRIHSLLGSEVLLAEKVVGMETLFGISPDTIAPLNRSKRAEWEGLEHIPLHQQSPRAGYAFVIDCLSQNAHLDLKPLIGQPALLEWQTDQYREQLRPIHGQITQACLLAANGGFARYRLLLEPALAFLAYRRDSWVFQNKTVPDIVSEVLADYEGVGMLSMRHRFELLDTHLYQPVSYLIQYQETDLAFISRILASSGLYYFFEHTAGYDDPLLGSHTLVITDQSTSGQILDDYRFHRSDTTESSDTVQQWSPKHQVTIGALDIHAWDYATLNTRPVSTWSTMDLPNELAELLSVEDDIGQYAYPDLSTGDRLAHLAIAAEDARSHVIFGAGSIRALSAGSHFKLTHHASPLTGWDTEAQSAAVRVISVLHTMRNNFDAKFSNAFEELGLNLMQPISGISATEKMMPQVSTWEHHFMSGGQTSNDNLSYLYHNVFSVIPEDLPYRPQSIIPPHVSTMSNFSGNSGLSMVSQLQHPADTWYYPKPTAPGPQTAIVVGIENNAITTDRNHRIKVQFHWQRGQHAHSRLEAPTRENNAPANEAASTWVRIGTSLAGNNYGGIWIPRIGQEVLIGFSHGDIDRPIVLGVLYNGEGIKEQTGNQVPNGAGVSTGNAPLWFNGNQHAAHLSGIVTQSVSDSQSGAAKQYNQLVFDDTPQQSRLELSSTQYESQLQLGHWQQQIHNTRMQSIGHGWSLSTQAYGAIRAGAGMLLSTHGIPDTAATLESNAPLAQLAEAHDLMTKLAHSAQDHQAMLANEVTAEALNACQRLSHTHAVLNNETNIVGNPQAISGGGTGSITAWSEPALVFAGQAGIGVLTPHSQIVSARGQFIQTAQNLETGTLGNMQWLIHQGAILFSDGKVETNHKGSKASPLVNETGIHLHAASGAVKIQAHDGTINLHAEKAITISSNNQISVDSTSKILIAAGGSAITIQNNSIILQSSGMVNILGMPKNHLGPVSTRPTVKKLPKGLISNSLVKKSYSQKLDVCNLIGSLANTQQASDHIPYSIRNLQGTVIDQGVTNHQGETARFFTAQKEHLNLYLGEGEWQLYVDVAHPILSHSES